MSQQQKIYYEVAVIHVMTFLVFVQEIQEAASYFLRHYAILS